MNTNLNEYTIAALRVLIADWKAKDGVGVTPEEAVAVAHILDIILDAGTGVVDSWEEGDLAGSVHELQIAMGYDLIDNDDDADEVTEAEETPEQWLSRQFEYEYCAECGGDAQHHAVASGPFGNHFAVCSYPPSVETNWEPHPVIAAFKKGTR